MVVEPVAPKSVATGALAWAAIGTVLYLVGAFAAFVPVSLIDQLVLERLGMVVEAGNIGLSVQDGLLPIAWGLLVAGVSLPIGRRLVASLDVSRRSWSLLSVGLVLAGTTMFLLVEYGRARFGYFGARMVGWSVVAPSALVAVALGGWACMAVPSDLRRPFRVLTIVAGAGFAIVVAPSVPGALDGIRAASIPLAVALGIDAVYVGAAALVALGLRLPGREGAQRRR